MKMKIIRKGGLSMAHTPEPWKILKVDEQGYVSSPEGKDLAITAGGIIAEVFYRIDDDIYADVEANARMMVNAPGMLKVLEWIQAIAKDPNHRGARTQIQMISFFDDVLLPDIEKIIAQVKGEKS